MWRGSKVTFCVVFARLMIWGQSVVTGPGAELVAMTSMPVLSRPKNKSSPADSKLGMIASPIGTLPAGTIFKNRGGLGRPGVIDRFTAELSHVLRMARVEGELPPASKANDPVELKTMEVAGAASW